MPAVASTMVPPGLSRPSASAASIIVRAGRSLIEPDGFALSSLRNSRHGPRSMRVTSMSGVLPMRSRTDAMATYSIAWGEPAAPALAISVPSIPRARRSPRPAAPWSEAGVTRQHTDKFRHFSGEKPPSSLTLSPVSLIVMRHVPTHTDKPFLPISVTPIGRS